MTDAPDIRGHRARDRAGRALDRAHAQSRNEDLARADSLFNAAKALVDSGQYDDACAKFAESKRLAPGLGVTLYLADCYEHTGRTASAWTEFRSAEGLARQRNDKRADVARGRAQALESKLERPRSPSHRRCRAPASRILRDGAAVSSDEWGLAVPVDPGDHVVVVSSPRATRSARSPPTSVPTPPPPPSASIASTTPRPDPRPNPRPRPRPYPHPRPRTNPRPRARPPPESASPHDPGATRRWLGVGIAAAGVAGVAVGAVFDASTQKSKLSQSNQDNHFATRTTPATGLACPCGAAPRMPPRSRRCSSRWAASRSREAR